MVQVNILLNEELNERLDSFVKENGIIKSFLVRKIISEYLDRKEEEKYGHRPEKQLKV